MEENITLAGKQIPVPKKLNEGEIHKIFKRLGLTEGPKAKELGQYKRRKKKKKQTARISGDIIANALLFQEHLAPPTTQKKMPAKSKDKAMQLQSVYYGDCVKHLEQWNARNFDLLFSARSLADLIYLDPPWNSNRIYNITVDKGDNADKGFTAQATRLHRYLGMGR